MRVSQKEELSIYQLIYISTLIYGNKLWVVTRRTRFQIEVVKMSFLYRVSGFFHRDIVRSSVIWEELGIEPLLLHIKKSQLMWLGHVVRMPPGRLPGEVFRARRRPRGRPRRHWGAPCFSAGLGAYWDSPE